MRVFSLQWEQGFMYMRRWELNEHQTKNSVGCKDNWKILQPTAHKRFSSLTIVSVDSNNWHRYTIIARKAESWSSGQRRTLKTKTSCSIVECWVPMKHSEMTVKNCNSQFLSLCLHPEYFLPCICALQCTIAPVLSGSSWAFLCHLPKVNYSYWICNANSALCKSTKNRKLFKSSNIIH